MLVVVSGAFLFNFLDS